MADSASRRDPKALLPLTPAVFHLLMGLSDGPLHGYALAKAVAADTGDAVRFGPGTLYGTLGRMTAAGLVHEDGADDRRRYFALTAFGRAVVKAEAHRLESLVGLARRKSLLSRAPK